MIQSWYGGWNVWVYTESAWESHIVLLYEWQQNFETKKTFRREWCKLPKKARTANPSATRMPAVANGRCLFCEKTRNTRKQHVEKICQTYHKNSWGLCQRSNQKKIRSAHSFEGARHWLGCSRSTLPTTCRRDYTREDDRHQETIKNTKTIEEQASNKTIYFQYIVQYVMGRIV